MTTTRLRFLQDIPSAILQAFRQHVAPRDFAVVLWVVDGLGAWVLADGRTRGLLPHLDASAPSVTTFATVFPSTTASALPTLAFGFPPAVHGGLGYTIWLPERRQRAYMLSGGEAQGVRVPESVLYPPQRTIFESLEAGGVPTAVVGPTDLRQSGFSRWIYSGARYAGYSMPGEEVDVVTALLDEGIRFVWVYWPYVDLAGHIAGWPSAETDRALRAWDVLWARGRERWRAPGDLQIWVTADHGLMATPPDRAIRYHDGRLSSLWGGPWAGERRAVYVAGPIEQWGHLRQIATVHAQDDVWKAGWYGGPPADPAFRTRVLDTVILMRRGYQMEQDGLWDMPIMAGAHGGRTLLERLVPLITAPGK